jgi:hypothetical protein
MTMDDGILLVYFVSEHKIVPIWFPTLCTNYFSLRRILRKLASLETSGTYFWRCQLVGSAGVLQDS